MNLIFLHGALGCQQHFSPLIEALNTQHIIHNIDFLGHGANHAQHPITIDHLTTQIEQYIQQEIQGDCMIVGYSMGGYVGLRLALKKISGLKSVICIATQLDWDQEKAQKEIEKINLETLLPIKEKLETEHQSGYQAIINTTHQILESIGKAAIQAHDFKNNTIPLHFLIGEKDKMVSAAFTKSFCDKIPNSSVVLLPNQGHLLERMDREVLAGFLKPIID